MIGYTIETKRDTGETRFKFDDTIVIQTDLNAARLVIHVEDGDYEMAFGSSVDRPTSQAVENADEVRALAHALIDVADGLDELEAAKG